MPDASRGFVDYDHVASRYRQGRTLPSAVLDRWGSAVSPYLPTAPIRVVDVGAGTGVFAGAWPRWARATVAAVEPSTAMAREADDSDPAVSFVRGVAEALPLRGGGASVIWVSTALHHFPDVHAAVAEFRRVLCAAGVVLVRTYVPGRTKVTWVDAFPGRPRWEARFHTQDELESIFGACGFALTDVIEVLEWCETYGESADWAESMRGADSMLTALTDDEVAEGLAALRSTPHEVGRLELTLLVFRRN